MLNQSFILQLLTRRLQEFKTGDILLQIRRVVGSFQNLNVSGNSILGSSTGTLINNPLTETWNVLSSAPTNVIQLASSQSGIYLAAITSYNLYVSSNYGVSWKQLTTTVSSSTTTNYNSVSVSASGQYIAYITKYFRFMT